VERPRSRIEVAGQAAEENGRSGATLGPRISSYGRYQFTRQRRAVKETRRGIREMNLEEEGRRRVSIAILPLLVE
jgi:hypothetical protein